MGARFHGRSANARDAGQTIRGGLTPAGASGFGEWWGGLVAVALVAVGVVLLTGSRDPGAGANPIDPSPRMLSAIEPSVRSLEAVDRAFASLCADPVLLALELEPNCETGVITLSDELFDGFDASDPDSFLATLDHRIYEEYLDDGGPEPRSIAVSLARRLHDHAITDAIAWWMKVPASRPSLSASLRAL